MKDAKLPEKGSKGHSWQPKNSHREDAKSSCRIQITGAKWMQNSQLPSDFKDWCLAIDI